MPCFSKILKPFTGNGDVYIRVGRTNLNKRANKQNIEHLRLANVVFKHVKNVNLYTIISYDTRLLEIMSFKYTTEVYTSFESWHDNIWNTIQQHLKYSVTYISR